MGRSVAQLEELRAECDKELNNARLMGAFLPYPSSSQRFVKVTVLCSGMEALAKSGVVLCNNETCMHKISRIEHSTRNTKA